MPLSLPAARNTVHQRTIGCEGFLRDDGLWDIEAHLLDTSARRVPSDYRGTIEAGEPIHEMSVRITIDDQMLIHAAQASTDFGPNRICPAATAGFASLTGLRIGPGWIRQVKQRIGGVKGCTHLTELLRPVATTAFQTLASAGLLDEPADGRPPIFLDACHAYARDGALVRQRWPAFYTGPDEAQTERTID